MKHGQTMVASVTFGAGKTQVNLYVNPTVGQVLSAPSATLSITDSIGIAPFGY